MAIGRDRLFDMVDRMPTFSQSVVRIIELTSDINTAPKDLVRLVEHDPILTMKVLKLVNSAYFGLSRKVSSIKQGVVYVGVNTIKHLAVSIAAIGALPRTNDANFDMDDFWTHSLITGAAAKQLSQHRGVPKGDATRFFIAGLLHDIGQVVLTQFMAQEYRTVLEQSRNNDALLVQLERQALDTDHAQVGAMLAERWQLPADFVNAIRNHHDIEALEKRETMDLTVFVANQIGKLKMEESRRIAAPEPLPGVVLDWLGMPLEDAMAALSELDTEIQNARSFVQVPMEAQA